MAGAEIKITFLGTGSAIPANNHTQVSFALKHKNGTILFDCGEGTQFQMRKYKISTRKEFIICISHLHSDHFLGLPGLLASFQLLGREDPIKIIGPKGMKILIQNLMIANMISISYDIEIIELRPNKCYIGNGYELKAIKAIHEGKALSYIWKENCRPGKMNIDKIKELGIPDGPLIGELQRGNSILINNQEIRPEQVQGETRRGRVIAYSGDTSPNIELIKNLNGICDVLVHEATYPSIMKELAKERNHTTLKDALEIGAQVKPAVLILTHLSPRFDNLKKEFEDVKEIYPPTIIARSGLIHKIPLIE